MVVVVNAEYDELDSVVWSMQIIATIVMVQQCMRGAKNDQVISNHGHAN